MNFGPKNKIKVGGGLASISAVVLVMLVFFLIMAVASKKEEQPVVTEPDDSFHPVVTVVITEDNNYYLLPDETEKDKRSFDNIKEQIISKMTEAPVKELMIQGHQLAKYETAYNVAGLAQKNNWLYRLDFTRQPAED
jgi:biopolymer transport protein ExbD